MMSEIAGGANLPVGSFVRVTEPGDVAPYFARIAGYDMFRTKYEVGRRFPGVSEWRFANGGTWVFPSWVQEVPVSEAIGVHPDTTDNNERRLPLDGQVLASTDFSDSYDTDRTIVTDLEQANLITSMIAEPDGSAGNLHKVVLDIDHPVKVVESSTPGHFHLFINVEIEWPEYLALQRGLTVAGIVEPGYLAAAEHRKHTAVRLPWIRKTPAEKEVTY